MDNFTQNNNNYDNDFSDLESGFVGANPIIIDKPISHALRISEIVTKSFIFMALAVLITAFTAYSMDVETALHILKNKVIFALFIADATVIFSSKWYIARRRKSIVMHVFKYTLKQNMPILACILYISFAFLVGLNLSLLFVACSPASITAAFFIAAALFAIMAVYGLITSANMTTIKSVCTMGIIGVVIALIVNSLFLRSSSFDTILSCAIVLIFVVLTAYHTQQIKERSEEATDENIMTLALLNGFELYLNLILIFVYILKIIVKKK